MIDPNIVGILRLIHQFATGGTWLAVALALAVTLADAPIASGQQTLVDPETDITSFIWDFSRADDPEFTKFPWRWKRVEGIGFPNYVGREITARNPEFETRLLSWDTLAVRWWKEIRKSIPTLPPLPPSITDMLVDRYLRVVLDGGQFAAQSPEIPVSRRYQYEFSCQIATRYLKHDSAFAEFVFLDGNGTVLETFVTPSVSGTTDWATLRLPAVQPPYEAASMLVRLKVLRSDDGLEDIQGNIGFDNIRIDQLPQLAVSTDQPCGVYKRGQSVTASAKIMGLPKRTSEVLFTLVDHSGEQIGQAKRRIEIVPIEEKVNAAEAVEQRDDSIGTAVSWGLPPLGPGFYRVTASIDGQRVATLASETTFVVIDRLESGPGHGCFGWTLPQGRQGMAPREVGPWLVDLGVQWVKYPCWLAPDDTDLAEETAMIFSRLQDQGIETIAMLDAPPDSQLASFELRGRRDLVAAQLFRNQTTWKPLLEPIMTRMTLKVRRWQLGADRDHSFLGRPRLNESITEISTGLQGFGQPIDVAISWPWEESQYRDGRSSWQAECRSSDPPLSADELDAYLSFRALDSRSESPNTWVLIDPISSKHYDQTTRIQDLVLRMATVRSHRVQAAFVSDPRNTEHGVLRPDGRPGELLLPWRTTSRLIGNLRKAGSLTMRGRTNNIVFVGEDRAVLMLWSPVPGKERLFLGEGAKTVDVWGRVKGLPIDFDGNQPGQVVETGPTPIFVIGADPSLLRFRMSVVVEPTRLDSLIGRDQPLTVSLTNPTDESLVGDLQILPPETWSIEKPKRQWQALAGRRASYPFDVVLTNIAMIGEYEVPIQFDIDTTPPKRITVYRSVTVGPEGIEIDTKSRLLNRDELLVQIEISNKTETSKSFDCLLFPPPGRQFQERVMTIPPGTTVRREFYWSDAKSFLGQQMTLRAVEQDGPRVINYRFRIRG